jgi:hypothetical protein
MPKGFVKHDFRRKADNAENTGHTTDDAIGLQLEGARGREASSAKLTRSRNTFLSDSFSYDS